MTEELKEDVIGLLQVFDIPYIIAPYEGIRCNVCVYILYILVL